MIYTELKPFLQQVLKRRKQVYIYDKHRKYARICSGFDIETTRIGENAYMYHWQVSMNEHTLLMRRWDDFSKLLRALDSWCEPKKCSIIMWVANLGHEFAFLCCRYKAKKIFATDAHTPLTVDIGRVQFRECLTISGQGGLANLADKYTQTKKLKGDLDYDVIRNSYTPLTDTELQYCINDVRILAEFAEYMFTEYSDKKLDLPLTSTGIVRNAIRAAVDETGQTEQIRAAVRALFPPRQWYNFVMEFLFRGGYTHANIWHVHIILDGIIGIDYTSSYPAVMLHGYYPTTPFIDCELSVDSESRFIDDEKMQSKCVWFIADFWDIERTTYHAIESEHKLIESEDVALDNGRVTFAKRVRVALTELDYEVYKKFYTWTKIQIVKAQCATRGKLPEYVLKPLRKFYKVKQRLKGTDLENSIEYKNAKAAVNSFYGCMVTRLKFYQWYFDENDKKKPWKEKESKKTYDKLIEKQVLSPFWGIYVTSWARFNLLSVLHEIDFDKTENNAVYLDTDSIYFFDCPRIREIVEKYNLEMYKINEQYEPEFHDIGAFSWIDADKKTGEPISYKFKTLGAKRYLKHYNGKSEITVSGMKKGTLENKIKRPFATDNSYVLYKDAKHKKGKLGYVDIDELFDCFNDDFILACDESLKLASAYHVEEHTDIVTDEHGNSEIMHEFSSVALVPIEFSITIKSVYKTMVNEIMKERRLPIWE